MGLDSPDRHPVFQWRHGRPQKFFQRLLKVDRYICLVFTCGTPTPAAVFHCVEKRLVVSLCQTLCMDSVLQKPENQNPGGCKCTTLHLRAGALGVSISITIV